MQFVRPEYTYSLILRRLKQMSEWTIRRDERGRRAFAYTFSPAIFLSSTRGSSAGVTDGGTRSATDCLREGWMSALSSERDIVRRRLGRVRDRLTGLSAPEALTRVPEATL
ncbi:hypothetical protein MTO96_002551 [Rhipicephalus appendiculatus]